MIAWDPIAQQQRWRLEYEGGNGSGTLATGGNLVFQARPDGTLVAYEAATGTALWEGKVGAGAATPATFEIEGRQYVAVLGGRGGPNGDPARVTAFALGTPASR
jgi:quinohemoprotein ethanol dehydrogenase